MHVDIPSHNAGRICAGATKNTEKQKQDLKGTKKGPGQLKIGGGVCL